MEADELAARVRHQEHDLAVLRHELALSGRGAEGELTALWWTVAALAVCVYALARRVRRAEEERATDGRPD